MSGSRSRRAALIPKEHSEADSCGENAACSEASSLQENRLPRFHIYAIKPTIAFSDKNVSSAFSDCRAYQKGSFALAYPLSPRRVDGVGYKAGKSDTPLG